MTLYYGASNNLAELIKTHLFIICMNNSGTTFLRNALATSRHTWNLLREGQHTFGFAGPSSIGLKAHKRWASEDYWIEIFTNSNNYDWFTIKRAWYFQAFSVSKTASVFVEKSPPFLLIVNQLVENFENARFLFMVRDPYAVVEGISRKSLMLSGANAPREKILKQAATHVITGLKYQRANIEKWGDRGVFFTYEQMCEQPQRVESMISRLVPELNDLVLCRRLKVREYDEELRNMNEQQIGRLTSDDRQQINRVFSANQNLMDFFKYCIRA
jgi:hypothetical protein